MVAHGLARALHNLAQLVLERCRVSGLREGERRRKKGSSYERDAARSLLVEVEEGFLKLLRLVAVSLQDQFIISLC